MNVLVTGGLGFIGSHTVVELLKEDNEVIIVDNLYNSNIEVLEKLEKITGKKIKFYQYDLTNKLQVEEIFSENHIDSVIHFAGYKAVGESVKEPLMYYSNNLISTINLLEMMKKYQVNNIVFSSSATVYGDPEVVPLTEDCKLGETTNPYGTSKAMMERILMDVQKAVPSMSVTLLRYFNPIGAHESGLIGENPNGIPNNLMPYIVKVATGELPELGVFGDDYPTHDGTGVRDYIHVVDLAKGHLKALDKARVFTGVEAYNLGTGKGYSVLEIVNAFQSSTGVEVKYKIVERRPGDIATCYADPSKARNELNWVAEKGISEMCEDSWRFTENNM